VKTTKRLAQEVGVTHFAILKRLRNGDFDDIRGIRRIGNAYLFDGDAERAIRNRFYADGITAKEFALSIGISTASARRHLANRFDPIGQRGNASVYSEKQAGMLAESLGKESIYQSRNATIVEE